MDWLAQMEKAVDDKSPVHGDLDTVIGLVEQHKNFEEELNSRTEQVEQLKQTAEELLKTAESDDAIKIKSQTFSHLLVSSVIWDLILMASSDSAVFSSSSAVCLSCSTCSVLLLSSSSKFL